METFSDDLRRERERLGVSIDRISEITKVSPRYLRALEEGDLFDLPGGVLRKGIVRGYLSALDLEVGRWMDRFEEVLQSSTPAGGSTSDAGVQEFAENVSRRRARVAAPPTGARWFGVALMTALLVVFGWCVWRFVLHGHVSLSSLPSHSFQLHMPGAVNTIL